VFGRLKETSKLGLFFILNILSYRDAIERLPLFVVLASGEPRDNS